MKPVHVPGTLCKFILMPQAPGIPMTRSMTVSIELADDGVWTAWSHAWSDEKLPVAVLLWRHDRDVIVLYGERVLQLNLRDLRRHLDRHPVELVEL